MRLKGCIIAIMAIAQSHMGYVCFPSVLGRELIDVQCLNHLNAHVAAQKHGNKRLPSGQCTYEQALTVADHESRIYRYAKSMESAKKGGRRAKEASEHCATFFSRNDESRSRCSRQAAGRYAATHDWSDSFNAKRCCLP